MDRFRSLLIRACVSGILVLLAASAALAQHTVTASWDRNIDTFTVGYRLFYGTTSGTYEWSVDVGNVISAPLNLSPGNYFFAVRAYNTSFQYGPPSNEVAFTIGSSEPAPTAAIQATLQGGNTALVTWQTTNAVSATLNGTSVPVNGSSTVAVGAGTTTFTIVARNASGQTATANASVTVGTSPPTAAIQATLQGGNTALVTWQTTNAVSATLNGASVPVNGSQTFTVTATTTYTIVARNAAGQTATASATVTVGTPPPTAAIQATLETPTTARVSWQTTNATSATINGNPVGLNGSVTVPVGAGSPTTFTLVARNAAGQTATATATVSGGSTAPTAAIQAVLQTPTTARVTWQTTNATSATINGTAVALNGTQTVNVTATTTFTIVARNAAGQTATANATVTVGGSAPTASIQATVLTSSSARLTWQTTNATTATVNGNGVPLQGNVTVPINGTPRTYTLVARNASGATATANVTVSSAGASGAPLAPVNINASVSGTHVALAWESNPEGGAPADYLLFVGTSEWASDVVNGVALGELRSVSADLPRGSYHARVRARNDAGVSPSSDPVLFRVGAQLASPTGLTASWTGTQATLSWVEASADSPEMAPTGYVLEAGTAPGLADVASIRVGRATTFSADVPHGIYYVRVRAVNDRGDSDATEDLVLAAPGTAAAPQTLTTGGDGSTVSLSWSAPSGGELPLGYLIEAGSDPGRSDLGTIQVGGATSFSTEAPAGTYFVRVRAINASGPGVPSNEVIVRK